MTDGAVTNVFDTVASPAFLKTEPGWEIVAALIEGGVEVRAANSCELMTVLARKGMPEHLAARLVADIPAEQVVLTFNLAIRAILRFGLERWSSTPRVTACRWATASASRRVRGMAPW